MKAFVAVMSNHISAGVWPKQNRDSTIERNIQLFDWTKTEKNLKINKKIFQKS